MQIEDYGWAVSYSHGPLCIIERNEFNDKCLDLESCPYLSISSRISVEYSCKARFILYPSFRQIYLFNEEGAFYKCNEIPIKIDYFKYIENIIEERGWPSLCK